jgi:hypothetical protein
MKAQSLEKKIQEAVRILGRIYEKIKQEKLDFTNSSLPIDTLLLVAKKIEKAYYQELD